VDAVQREWLAHDGCNCAVICRLTELVSFDLQRLLDRLGRRLLGVCFCPYDTSLFSQILLDAEIKVLVVELSSDSSVSELDVGQNGLLLQYFSRDLELKGFKDCLVIEKSGELDICDKLLHVHERQTHILEH